MLDKLRFGIPQCYCDLCFHIHHLVSTLPNFRINSLIIFCCSKIRTKNKASAEKFSPLLAAQSTYSFFLHLSNISSNKALFRNAYPKSPHNPIFGKDIFICAHVMTFKGFFSANEIPESDDKTDAFYRRWIIFHFDKKFQYGS